jgi:hypothetical protein
MGDLHVYDAGSSTNANVRSKLNQYFYARPYEIEIECNAGKVNVKVDKDLVSTAELGPRKQGGVELLVHCETDVVIDQLEITGKLEPGSVAALRRAWADQKLATMGF